MAGHGDPRVTRRYAHMRGGHLREVHKRANPLGKIVEEGNVVPVMSKKKRL